MRIEIYPTRCVSTTAGSGFSKCGLCTALATLLILMVTVLGNSVHAGLVSGRFRIDTAESARLLEAMLQKERGEITQSQFHAIQQEESCKNPSIRLIDRNRPAIVIQNTSDPNAPDNRIIRFMIDLQQEGYEFGTGDFDPDPFAGGLTIPGDGTDPGVSFTSSYGTVSESDPTIDRTKLLLDINGLTRGRALIFHVDLDPVPMDGLAFPDYRHVMLGADMVDEPNSPVTNPALISATFATGEGASLMTQSTVPTGFAPGFEEILTNAGMLEPYHSQSSAEMFTQIGETVIPEPSAGLLLWVGFIGMTMQRRQSRGR